MLCRVFEYEVEIGVEIVLVGRVVVVVVANG